MVVDLSVNTYLLNTERRTPWLVFAVRLLRRGGGRGRLEGGHRIPGRSCRPWGGAQEGAGRGREEQGGERVVMRGISRTRTVGYVDEYDEMKTQTENMVLKTHNETRTINTDNKAHLERHTQKGKGIRTRTFGGCSNCTRSHSSRSLPHVDGVCHSAAKRSRNHRLCHIAATTTGAVRREGRRKEDGERRTEKGGMRNEEIGMRTEV